MKTGTVIGRIVASKRLPELPPGALLEVQLDYPKDVVVCFDPMGCGIGEREEIANHEHRPFPPVGLAPGNGDG